MVSTRSPGCQARRSMGASAGCSSGGRPPARAINHCSNAASRAGASAPACSRSSSASTSPADSSSSSGVWCPASADSGTPSSTPVAPGRSIAPTETAGCATSRTWYAMRTPPTTAWPRQCPRRSAAWSNTRNGAPPMRTARCVAPVGSTCSRACGRTAAAAGAGSCAHTDVTRPRNAGTGGRCTEAMARCYASPCPVDRRLGAVFNPVTGGLPCALGHALAGIDPVRR